MLDIFKHLLPNAKAWRLSSGKRITQLFTGWGVAFAEVRVFFDDVWGDLFPAGTRQLDEWESQFALPDTGLTEQERRDRLDATWKALGGQDPQYIQDTLRAAGFDVYVHEWWVPSGLHPFGGAVDGDVVPVVRDPFDYLWDGVAIRSFTSGSGHDLAYCGGDSMFCSSSDSPPGYALVNKEQADPVIPVDPLTWPYFLYIGASTFPGQATIQGARRDEFETLCLKICPTEQWLGVLVNYS